MTRIVRRHLDEDVQLWFEDEARVGQKGRNTHVWYQKRQRPVAPTDKPFKSSYIYGAVGAGSDDASGLVLPRADTAMMGLFLEGLARTEGPRRPCDGQGGMARHRATGCRRTSASCISRPIHRS